MKASAPCSLIILRFIFSLETPGAFAQQAQQAADLLTSLNDQAIKLYQAGKYTEALPIAKRVLTIAENMYGPDDARAAENVSGLGQIYLGLGDYLHAQTFLERALQVREKALDPYDPDTARSLNNLGA